MAIQLNCAALFAMLRSSTLFKSYNFSEERIISFERTKTNHDKLPRENNGLTTTPQITLCIFKLCFLEITSENLGLLT